MHGDQFARALSRYFPVLTGPEQLDAVPALLANEGNDAEFCAGLRFDPEMVAQTCRAGFMPMGLSIGSRDVLLVKCHVRRCVLAFSDLHIGKSTRRRSRGLRIRSDHDFAGCLDSVVRYHPDRWLVDPLCDALVSLSRHSCYGVRARSVEVYRGDRLVAGEIGYTWGGVYTSLTGFHTESGVGSVQLACLGRLLSGKSFSFWDLGMEVEYKLRLGARLVDRSDFLEMARVASSLPTPDLGIDEDCRAVLENADAAGADNAGADNAGGVR